MADLNAIMQERLEKWRKSTLEVKSAEKVRGDTRNYVARKGDYGDDIRDFEIKDERAWVLESQGHPHLRR